MRKRLRLPAVTLLVILGLAGWFWWERAHQPPPQIITLPNGEQFRFAGTTYGTRNVPPSFEARVVSWLPAPVAKLVKQRVGTRISQWNEGGKYETPQLFVWFQRLGTNKLSARQGYLTAMLSDDGGVQAGMEIHDPAIGNGMVWSFVACPVFPRRNRTLQLTLYEFLPATPNALVVGTVTIPNPLYRHYEQWKAEPVPAVKQAGDLQVRLDGLAAGNPNSASTSPIKLTDYRPVLNGERAMTGFDWSLVSPSAKESWVLHAAELSDATGNVLRNDELDGSVLAFGPTPSTPTAVGTLFQGTLWPDEAAWRLKLVLKRASGIAPGEFVTFTNLSVPVMGTTNKLFLSQTVGGIQVVLTEFVHHPDMIMQGSWISTERISRIKVELPAKPAGLAVDFLETTPAARSLGLRGSVAGSAYVFYLNSIPANVQNMYFTFAVQKTRTVEFLVAPPKAK